MPHPIPQKFGGHPQSNDDMAIPDWCESCEKEEPSMRIVYRDPRETVYYCRECCDRHRTDDKAQSVTPIS